MTPIFIDDYNYPLPDDRIAAYPLAERDASKLLVYNNHQITQDTFNCLPQYLPDNSLLVFNDTKVIEARLHFRKQTGALIEIFCLEPLAPAEYTLMFQSQHSCRWKCLVGNLKKWKQGELSRVLEMPEGPVELTVRYIAGHGSWHEVEFSWNPGELTFSQLLPIVGELPIPPYLNRPTEAIDQTRYQTIYSRLEGSVAAPTAGLHFTQQTFNALADKNIAQARVTLHVGAGTFKPVSEAEVSKHEMHTEHFQVTHETLLALKNNLGNITAVGTTTVRTLESLYWLAVNIQNKHNLLKVGQFDPYEQKNTLTAQQALEVLTDYLLQTNSGVLYAASQIMIMPGYRFRMVDRIITNFHQPKSTLLLLVSAFIGEDWKKVYQYALENQFRFLSYGDSSLLFKKEA